MLNIRKNNDVPQEVLTVITSMTKDFIEFSMSDVQKYYPVEYNLIDVSPNRMKEVYRHSLCMALNLPSKPMYTDIDAVYPVYAERMRNYTDKYESKTHKFKLGVLQAGVNCWGRFADYRRKG